jgi:hypothetical protein
MSDGMPEVKECIDCDLRWTPSRGPVCPLCGGAPDERKKR